jgi:isoquinoline 1-oxidoreductase beta subunit
VIAWPPSFGAKLVSFDAAEAKKVKGVTDVVQVPEGVAVVATGTWAALQGRRALKVVWDESTSGQLDSDRLLASYRAQARSPAGRSRGRSRRRRKPSSRNRRGGLRVSVPRYATMEPMNLRGLAARRPARDLVRPSVPDLRPHVRGEGRRPADEKVKLHTLVSGGSFGRRANAWSDFTVAAVNVARRSAGRAPVRLQYTREDDTGPGSTGRWWSTPSRRVSMRTARSPAGSTRSSASRSSPARRWRC